MNQASKQLETISRGWSLQLYSSDRRLICAFDPSHGWIFAAGIALGFCIAAIGFRQPITVQYAPAANGPAANAPMNAPLGLD